jgi:hypothetical protein
MFRHVVICLGVLAVGSVQAGEAEKFFTERAKDFGTVPFGQTQVHHFKVTNTSDKPVYITGVGVSCGCVTATLQANALRPGDSTFVTASMDTKRFIGQKEVIVYVNFAQPHEQVNLTVRANRNDNFSKSADALHLGQVRKGAEGSGAMHIVMRNESGFEIRSATSGTDYVKPSVKLVRRDQNEVVYEISATLQPGLDTGSWTTDLVFTTNSGTLPSIRIPLYADVVAAITATPATVQFPAVKVGEKKELSVVVKGDKPFKIIDVKGGDGLVTAHADGSEAKQAHVVRLVFQPSAAGDLSKTITVVTDGGAEGKITIPVRGKARGDE